jgi:hypothetical protein
VFVGDADDQSLLAAERLIFAELVHNSAILVILQSPVDERFDLAMAVSAALGAELRTLAQ